MKPNHLIFGTGGQNLPPLPFRLPRIIKLPRLPQWIISSSKGAYHPPSRTIWINSSLPTRKFLKVLLHELGHWFLDICFPNNPKPHQWWDKS